DEHPLAERLELLLGAGRGLAAAHDAGLVHGDFKPENILVGIDGRARVADFGLALPVLELDLLATEDGRGPDGPGLGAPDSGSRRRSEPVPNETLPRRAEATSMTLSGVFGTPAYIAPEQFMRARIDARADQFAFCVVACELLLGRRPFAGDGVEALATAALTGDFVDLDDRRVPRSVRAVLRRGLAADPTDRFADMPELLRRLEAGFSRGRTRRRWVLAATAAGTMAVGLWMGMGSADSPREAAEAGSSCESAEAQLQPIWTRERADTIVARLSAAAPRGSEAASVIVDRIDDQARSWGEAWTLSCGRTVDEATRQRTEACLDERLLELSGVVEALADESAELAAPLSLLGGLDPVDRCLDVEILDVARPVPLEAELRVQVDAVRTELLGPSELAMLRSKDEGISLAQQGLQRATELGYRPLVAEAQLVLGRALRVTEDLDEAATMLEAAHLTAQASRHAYVLAEAATSRVEVAYQVPDLPTARAWLERAEAANEAAGGVPGLNVRLRATACIAALNAGDLELAIEECERAQSLIDQGARVDVHVRSVVVTNLGIAEWRGGRFTRAEARFEEAAELAELDLAGGAALRFAISLHGGHLAYDRGDYELALTRYHDAKEHLGLVDAARSSQMCAVLVSIAGALRQLGRLDEAESMYAQALELAREIDDYWTIRQAGTELAWVSLIRGDYQAAYDAWVELRGPALEQLGPEHPLLLEIDSNIGEAQALLGEVDEGLAKMDAVIETVERIHGVDHPELAFFLPSRGFVASKLGRWQACRDDFGRTLEIERRRSGAGSPAVARLQVERAECRLELGEDPATLIPELEAAIAVLDSPGNRDAEAYGRLELGRAYLRVGDARAAEQLMQAQRLLRAWPGEASDALAKIDGLLPAAERLAASSDR
ncbi:MAG: serine/threonine-protein kinase, partial [Nannocystaceae bacterium]